MLHISFGSDINYAMQCGVAITSLCENNKDIDLNIHILALCDDAQIAQFDPLLDIIKQYSQQGEVIRVDSSHFKDMPEGYYISRAAYLRLLLPVLLKEDISQVLYLDSDLVILESLRYFIDNPLEPEEAAAAAIDLDGNSIQHHNMIDIPAFVPYFNSGVLFINLSYWRTHNITRKALDNIVKYQYAYQDQDAINALLYDKIRILPFKYNLQVGYLQRNQNEYGIDKKYYEEIDAAKKAPAILHYASYKKPWQKDCPYQELWVKYKNMTQWKDLPLVSRKLNRDSLNELIEKSNKEAGVWLINTADYYQFLIHLANIRGGQYIISFMSLQFRFFVRCSKVVKSIVYILR